MKAANRRHTSSAGNMLTALPLYVSAVADTFGGALQDIFPLAFVVRSILVLAFFTWVLDSPVTTSSLRNLLLATLAYLMGALFVRYLSNAVVPLISMDLSASFRLLYTPLLLGYVAGSLRTGRLTLKQLNRAAVMYGWLVLLSLFLGNVTGLGGEIGGRGVGIEAGKGFMIGANEVGLMLMLSCPFVVVDLHRRIGNLALTALISLGLYATAGVHVFTKSSLAAPIVCAVSLYGLCRARGATPLMIARALILLFTVGVGIALLQLLEIVMEFADRTFFSALLNEGIVPFLFRGRQDYIDALYPQLANDWLYALSLIFGSGEYALRQMSLKPLSLGNDYGSNFEMDLFDLVGAFGLVGAALYFALIKRTLQLLPPLTRWLPGSCTAMVGTIVHAFMAGHVVFSPQVTTLMILTIAAAIRPDVIESRETQAQNPTHNAFN